MQGINQLSPGSLLCVLTHPDADAVCLCVPAVVVPQWLISVEDIIKHTRGLDTSAVKHTPVVVLNTQSQLALDQIRDLHKGSTTQQQQQQSNQA